MPFTTNIKTIALLLPSIISSTSSCSILWSSLVAMSTLKVHGTVLSPNTQRVLVALAEKNVDDYHFEPVDMSKRAHKSPEYLKLQPFGALPMLQDGDFTLFESRAMIRYICEKFEGQGASLLGKTLKEKALVNQWLEVESQNYNGVVSTIVNQKYFIPTFFGRETDEKIVSEQLAKLEKVLDVYEAHLSKNKYLAGDFFSIADLAHLPLTNYLINTAKEGNGIISRKHVNAWWEDISSRPAWKKVLSLRQQ